MLPKKQQPAASLNLSDIEFQRLGYDDDLRFVILAETTASEYHGTDIYNDCANVVGIIGREEFRRMLLRAIKVAAGFDPLFAALLGDELGLQLDDGDDDQGSTISNGDGSEE